MRSKPLNGFASQLPLEPGTESPPGESFQNQWWNIVRRASQLDATASGVDGSSSRKQRDNANHFLRESVGRQMLSTAAARFPEFGDKLREARASYRAVVDRIRETGVAATAQYSMQRVAARQL